MILVLDNNDSFTYNLVQCLEVLGGRVQVLRNEGLEVEEVVALAPEKVVISPGPRAPDEAGICLEVVRVLAGRVPLLGVCLGHQAIGQAFGGRVVQARRLRHGKTARIEHDGRTLFAGVPRPLVAGCYNSLAVECESLPACLEVSARDEEGQIMGLRHRAWPVEGVQFHPESVLTRGGERLLENFLKQ